MCLPVVQHAQAPYRGLSHLPLMGAVTNYSLLIVPLWNHRFHRWNQALFPQVPGSRTLPGSVCFKAAAGKLWARNRAAALLRFVVFSSASLLSWSSLGVLWVTRDPELTGLQHFSCCFGRESFLHCLMQPWGTFSFILFFPEGIPRHRSPHTAVEFTKYCFAFLFHAVSVLLIWNKGQKQLRMVKEYPPSV